MYARFGVAALISVVLAVSALAHHSHAQYEETFTDLTGIVKEVHYLVPHTFVYLEVKDPKGGEAQVWALEAIGGAVLKAQGVTPDYVQPGDQVKVRCHVLRDGSNGCLLGFLKAKDGTVKDWDGTKNPAPADF
jgi:hypothetical protein